MSGRDPKNPADCRSTEDRKWTSRRRPNMNAKIQTFSSHGDTTLLEYDPATADMDEVNREIAEYEAKTGAQPFREVLMVPPIAGGYKYPATQVDEPETRVLPIPNEGLVLRVLVTHPAH